MTTFYFAVIENDFTTKPTQLHSSLHYLIGTALEYWEVSSTVELASESSESASDVSSCVHWAASPDRQWATCQTWHDHARVTSIEDCTKDCTKALVLYQLMEAGGGDYFECPLCVQRSNSIQKPITKKDYPRRKINKRSSSFFPILELALTIGSLLSLLVFLLFVNNLWKSQYIASFFGGGGVEPTHDDSQISVIFYSLTLSREALGTIGPSIFKGQQLNV